MLRKLRLATTGLLLSCAFLASGRAQTADAQGLPLPETYFPELKGILETAVKQSPRMLLRNLDDIIAEQNRISARSGQLPSASGFLQYNPWQRDKRADLTHAAETQKLYYNFNINQPLFHWGALHSGTRIGELQQMISTGQTADAYRTLVLEIRSLYMQLVLKKALLARAQLNVQIATDQLSVAQTKFEKKVISEGGMFMPRINHDQALLMADRASEDFDSAKRAFSKLTGMSPLADSQIPDGFPAVTPSTDALSGLLAGHVANRDLNSYSLENMRHQLEIEKLNYQVATTRLKPMLNMILGTSQEEQSYTANIAQKYKLQSTYAGVQVSWSIFDGFSTRSAKASALARQHQLEQNYADAVAGLSEQARSQLKQLDFSARSMEISNRLLGSSEGNLHGREDDLRRGLASEADVSGARLYHLDAELNAFNNRADYLQRTSDFLSTILEDPALANLPKRTP